MGLRPIAAALFFIALAACSAKDPLEGAGFSTVATSRADARVIYTAAGDSVFRSDDRGETWTPLPPWGSATNPTTKERYDSAVTRLAVSPADSNVVLLGS